MPISAGLREDIAVYRGFIGQQYFLITFFLIIIKNNKTIYIEIALLIFLYI